MKFVISVFLVLFLSACGGSAIDTRGEAQAAFEAYVETLNSSDIEGAAKYYDEADGFHWIERGGIQYEKGSDAAASLKGMTSGGGLPQMTVDTIRVAELADGAALVSAHFDFAMLSANKTPIFSFDGWMTVGMVKRADGWRIAGGQTGPGSNENEGR